MHAWLGAEWIRPLAVAHVLSAFLFVAFHAPSVAAMLLLRRERDLAKVQALLDLSRQASQLSWIGWVLLGTTGALLALLEHAWRLPWVWGSALVLVLVSLAMSPLAARAMNEAREAAGLSWFDGRRLRAPLAPDPAALDVALARIRRRSVPVTLLGSVGLALLVWLMVWRPG